MTLRSCAFVVWVGYAERRTCKHDIQTGRRHGRARLPRDAEAGCFHACPNGGDRTRSMPWLFPSQATGVQPASQLPLHTPVVFAIGRWRETKLPLPCSGRHINSPRFPVLTALCALWGSHRHTWHPPFLFLDGPPSVIYIQSLRFPASPPRIFCPMTSTLSRLPSKLSSFTVCFPAMRYVCR